MLTALGAIVIFFLKSGIVLVIVGILVIVSVIWFVKLIGKAIVGFFSALFGR